MEVINATVTIKDYKHSFNIMSGERERGGGGGVRRGQTKTSKTQQRTMTPSEERKEKNKHFLDSVQADGI